MKVWLSGFLIATAAILCSRDQPSEEQQKDEEMQKDGVVWKDIEQKQKDIGEQQASLFSPRGLLAPRFPDSEAGESGT